MPCHELPIHLDTRWEQKAYASETKGAKICSLLIMDDEDVASVPSAMFWDNMVLARKVYRYEAWYSCYSQYSALLSLQH